MHSWKYLEQIAELPPRASATEGERQAAAWLNERLEALGFDVETQPFASPRYTLYLGPVIVIAVILFALGLSKFMPALATLLAVAAAVPLVGELLGAPVNFNLLLPKHPSQNVIARPAATGRRGAPDVVIVAHYDVQWASWLFAPWFVRLLQPFFIAAYVGVVLAVIAAAARWLAPGAGWVGGAASAAAWILALAGGFLFVSWLTGGPSPGANDNGSGVAVALALAERWTEAARGGGTAGAAALTPWFVFTGCEEVGLRGMHRFLADADLPKDTIFLNIDNVGGGRLRYFLGEGMLAYQRYDAGLIELAAEVSRYSGDQVKPLKNWLLPTDGLLPAKAGYRALSFLALCDDHRIPNYHWHTDTIDNVDRSVVELTEQFLWDCLQAVAARRPPAA